jgi:hypothetical protein
MNMDYCVNAAMKYNMDGIRWLILYYDLMCQYWKNLRRRFDPNPYLHFPADKEIRRAIGLFHVHGHIDPCFARYAPSFIPGAGQVDGEILETLWAVLNLIHNSIRRMSESHRRETLDDHMNDSNWKKIIGMGELMLIIQWMANLKCCKWIGCAGNFPSPRIQCSSPNLHLIC